jgi:phage tail-like protein
MATVKTSSKTPLPKFHFRVEFGGVVMGFTEVSGLVPISPVNDKGGSIVAIAKRKIPGIQKWATITMKRGMLLSSGKTYRELFKKNGSLKIEKREATLRLYDEQHQLVNEWKLKNAWPAKLQSSDLKADGNEVAIESMELVCEGIELIKN